ncbi:CheR family methyltransferase [Microbispora sp. H10885]|uniref:CheR family methyltransferase n=1 Tax=Microbispora sp. H10885 TaxID=2729110 RepID=UPI001603520B|nr:CheR family methyltransferase [Microbispora sp. H10885]
MHTGEEREFDDLLLMLKETRGFDFTGYKRTTLRRRVGRRLQALKLESVEEYRDYLELEPAEFTTLFDSLLINVTGFFRDPAAWQVLRERAIPPILAAKGGRAIRAWSAGCASGEEAYSLAILLAEELGFDEFRDRVKIYGTDVDEKALHAARVAVYGERQMAGVPPEFREKYFEPVQDGSAFRRDLRRQLIFGRNDLTRDAPISRVDILLARNTLMYFNGETQIDVVRRFHFALCDPGYLFLGKAEMLLNHSDRFDPVDLRMRLFRKRPQPPAATRLGWDHSAQPESQTRLARLHSAANASGPVAQLTLDASGALALINTRAEVLFGLQARDLGRPFQDLEVSYRPVELRSVIEQAELDLRTVELQDVAWNRPGAQEPGVFDIVVVPLIDTTGELIGATVNFHDVTRNRRLRDELEQTNKELEHAYEDEELQPTNEELETTNEELQSTNEELETMNEELQSSNDELQQINDMLNARTVQFDRANRFVGSVVRSLGDAVIVLDRDLRVLLWSSGAQELWGLRPEEAAGHALHTLDIGLPVETLLPGLRRMLDGGPPGGPQPPTMSIDAVNRRGRTARLSITVTPLHENDASVHGLILVLTAE